MERESPWSEQSVAGRLPLGPFGRGGVAPEGPTPIPSIVQRGLLYNEEAQRGAGSCSRLHSHSRAELRSGPRASD